MQVRICDKGARRLYVGAEEALGSTQTWVIIVTLCVEDVRKLDIGRVGVLECEFHQRNLHVRPQPKDTRTIEHDIGRVGVLECGFHYKGEIAYTPSFARSRGYPLYQMYRTSSTNVLRYE